MTTTTSTSSSTSTATAVDADDLGHAGPSRTSTVLHRIWPPLVVFGLAIGLWYLISYRLLDADRRFLMPPPHQVLIEGFLDEHVRTEIMQSLQRTAVVAMTGLAVAIVIGVGWAIAMAQARWIERSLFPYAVMLQCIPVLALVPLIGFWFGFGYFSRVVVCVMIALFPMVSNTLFGLQSVDARSRDLFRLHRANRFTVLTKLELRTATPAIFAGMRISAGLAVVGAIVADFFFRQGEPGIGTLISRYQAQVQSPELFAAIIVASLFGVLVFVVFGWLGKRAVGSWYDATK
jgi:NitT/TauT family transport system permease protein